MQAATDFERVTCPHCGADVEVARGGWPYRYTQLLQHLADCAAELSQQERQRLAAMATAS
jgi:hypothetical protein